MTEKYESCLRLNEKEKKQMEFDAKQFGLRRNAYCGGILLEVP